MEAQAPGSGKPRQSVSARALWLAAAALVLVVSTAIAFTQPPPRRDPYATTSVSDLAWWLSPIERNAFARLPVIVGDLHDLFVVPGTETIWVVGDGGMIARSRDGGRTWQQQNIPSATASPPSGPGRSRAPAPPASRGIAVVARAEAEIQKGDDKSKGEDKAGPQVRVPNVVGESVGKARVLLKEAGLELRGADSGGTPDAGDVIRSQRPPPGTAVSPGAVVSVLVERYAPRPTQRTPTPTPPAPTPPTSTPTVVEVERPSLFAVHFVDERRGWAVGEAGIIVATSDGGESWQRIRSGAIADLRAVHFHADGRRGWAAGAETILATTDGGQRWRAQVPLTRVALPVFESITFDAEGRRGWAVGSADMFFTSNGGESWERVRASSSVLRSVHFHSDGQRGWAAGQNGTIVTTTDGGRRWRPLVSGTTEELTSIRFAPDGRRGWAVGRTGTLLTTADAGDRWEARSPGTRAHLHAVAGDGRRGWIAGHEGTVLATTDGGLQWTTRAAGRRAVLRGLHVAGDGRDGWAVGDDGILLALGGWGRSWDVRPTGTLTTLLSTYVLPGGRGWAVGDEGVIVSSADGETRAERKEGSGSARLTSVQLTLDGRSGWATSAGGEIFVTENGGGEWKRRRDAGGILSQVSMTADGASGWAVGAAGTILATTDRGATWAPQASGTSVWLRAVHAGQGRRGWAVGDEGTILATLDGARWQRQSSPTDVSLRSIHVHADGLLGWAVGSRGTILATTNGGASWQPQSSGTGVPLHGVRFAADGRRGWIAGWGALLHTSDGGATWAPVAHTAFPAPWYYPASALALLLLLPALRRPDAEVAPRRSVADMLVSDKPLELGEPDPLGFGQLAAGLSRFLRNEQTKPPLTIAVTGPWGAGKSSLMNLVRGDLRARGFRPVWFNAWHHQKEEHLLAALLQSILAQSVPGFFSRGGLLFRARLLRYRWGRRWYLVLPMLALLSGASGFYAADHPTRWQAAVARATTAVEQMVGIVTPLFPEGVKKSLDEAKKALREALGEGTASSAIPTGVATLVLLFMVWRGMTAFGVNPADLMATVSGRVKRRDLEAKVGFRHEFAQQFRDVTRALHPRTMLILVDDLDRCRPENVLDVLEAVNFLVSSGDCFVIMGMELDRVRRCVGLGFKDVAEELTDREEAQTPEAPGLAAEHDQGKRRRAVFAQQYLEKLVNIEVPVPVPTEEQAARLIVREEARDEDRPRWRALAADAGRFSRTAAPVAAVLVAFVGSFCAALVLWPATPSTTLVVQTLPPAVTTDTGTDSPAPPTPSRPSGPPSARTPREAPDAVIVSGAPAAPSRWLTAWPLTGLTLAALLVFLQRPAIVVRDSNEFREALKAWHPLVFSRRSTPRAVKRFLNRVRFYAMRQREQPEERRIDRLAGWMLHWRRATSPRVLDPAAEAIPERILVGLSAIEHCHPQWLSDARLFKDPEGFLADQALPGGLQPDMLGLGRDLGRYRQIFEKLSAGVRT